MHGASAKVNRRLTMTITAVEGLVAATLQDIKKYGAISALAVIVPMSYRTLYRHAEDDPKRRPVLGGKTLRVLSGLFAELGILEDHDRAAMLAAIAEIERRAAIRSAEDDPRTDETHRLAHGGE
jgi:hypothetical protein